MSSKNFITFSLKSCKDLWEKSFAYDVNFHHSSNAYMSIGSHNSNAIQKSSRLCAGTSTRVHNHSTLTPSYGITGTDLLLIGSIISLPRAFLYLLSWGLTNIATHPKRS